MIELSELTAQARRATEELLEAAHLETGDIFVVGLLQQRDPRRAHRP